MAKKKKSPDWFARGIIIPTYDTGFGLLYGNDIDVIAKEGSKLVTDKKHRKEIELKLKSYDLFSDRGSMSRITCLDGTYYFFMIINNPNYTTIAHECIHLCSYIFDRVGAVINEGSEECYAYLHSHLMIEVIRGFQDNNIHIKPFDRG